MFPNSQDALPLPPKPNVEQYKKLAKDLLNAAKSFKSRDPNAIGSWAVKWIEALARLHPSQHDPERVRRGTNRRVNQVSQFATRQLTSDEAQCRLSEAQFVIARLHGFESWPKLLKHIDGLLQKSSTIARFEAAA